MTLGERLKHLRNKRTQEEVAKYIGISRARYSHYENGRSEPDNDILRKLSIFYGVSTDYLLTGKERGQLSLFPNEHGLSEVPENNRLPIRFKEALEANNISVEKLAIILKINESKLHFFLKQPTFIDFSDPEEIELLERMASALKISYDELLGRNLSEFNHDKKTEKDIAKRLKQFEAELENSDGLAFDGEPMSDEAKESLLESMELLFRQTQRINKKFTPKKYKDEE